jgi:glutamine---fructose-6-phosphate transaminase (isomerizing)
MLDNSEQVTGKYPASDMAREIDEAPGVFAKTVLAVPTAVGKLAAVKAIYTVARGSSDAAANILSYEWMSETGVPVTSLPPSVFSLGDGVRLDGAAVLVVSQSGASDDLVRTAENAANCGAHVVALTNVAESKVEQVADHTVAINAGEEIAVPATKSVIGSVAAGMALLAAVKPGYIAACQASARAMTNPDLPRIHRDTDALVKVLSRAENVYVIGRGAGFGAAQEVALKLKETCALHAEAYSASEVLHGPLQLATKPLTVLILDTGEAKIQPSLDLAEERLRAAGGQVFRIRATDMGTADLVPAAAAAMLLYACYPIVLRLAHHLGHDPDKPDKLAKVTRTL